MERTMTCKDIQIMLIERMFGKLAASDRARLEEHLRTCPECLRLARSSPEIPFRGLSDDDIVLPDQEASWRAIWSQTAPGRRKRLSAFRKWAAATAGLAETPRVRCRPQPPPVLLSRASSRARRWSCSRH